MKRAVCLYGRLKAEFGDRFDLDVDTAGDAIRCLQANFPTFLDVLKNGEYELVRGDAETGMRLSLEEINTFKLGSADLHVIPVIGGSKSAAGAIKAIAGVAIAGAAIFASGGTLAAPVAASGLLSGVTYGNIALLGAALALSGISKMLTPKTTANKTTESYSITGPTNNYEQGNAVPLIYGRVMTGSVLISSGVDIEELAINA